MGHSGPHEKQLLMVIIHFNGCSSPQVYPISPNPQYLALWLGEVCMFARVVQFVVVSRYHFVVEWTLCSLCWYSMHGWNTDGSTSPQVSPLEWW